MVLERYADNVIEHVTHPVTGIQRKSKFPPTIPEIVEICDDTVAVNDRLARYRAMGPTVFRRQPRPPRHRANVFVPAGNDLYPVMLERSKTADQMEWRFDENRAGIWVALGWVDDLETKAASSGPRRFTKADFDALPEVAP